MPELFMSAPLVDLVAQYTSSTPTEAAKTAQLHDFLTAVPGHEAFGRELAGTDPEWGHVTGSAWIVNEDNSRVVLVHHRKLGKWLQPGGHCDGETNPLDVAIREAQEETGLEVVPVTAEIFDIDVHEIPEYWNTPAHNHYDVRFLLRATGSAAPVVSHESHAVKWFSLDEVLELTSEESVVRMVDKTRVLEK